MAGIDNFRLIDETYTVEEPGEDNEILLKTDHDSSMKSIAWCRTYRESRVFCYQSGHDNTCFADGNFRRVLESGILWAADPS